MTDQLESTVSEEEPRIRPTAELDVFRQLLSAPDTADDLDVPPASAPATRSNAANTSARLRSR
jgi:hypothetical protein